MFSQSLLSLDLIEDFLARADMASESSNEAAGGSIAEQFASWAPGKLEHKRHEQTAFYRQRLLSDGWLNVSRDKKNLVQKLQ